MARLPRGPVGSRTLLGLSFLVHLALGLSARAAADDIVIAVPAPLGNARGGIGLSVHTAAGIAAAEINAAGGINGRQLVLDLHDDPCVSGGNVALIRAVAASRAVAVIGHACAPSATVAAPIYHAAGKVFVAAGARTRLDLPRALRLPAREPQADMLARAIVADVITQPGSRIAIVRDKTQLNIALATALEAALKASGQSVTVETFTGGDKDFTALARRLAAADISHVAVMAFTVEAALIAADIVRVRPDIRLYGPDQIATPDFPALAGTAAAARVRVVLPVTAAVYTARHADAATLAARLTAVDVTPSAEALETAASIQAFAAAARATAEPTAERISAELRTPRATLLGPLAFDAQGNASLPAWIMHHWRDGVLQPMP